MKELLTRAITGLVYVLSIFLAIYFGVNGVALLMLAFGLIAFWEYGNMVDLGAFKFPLMISLALSILVTWIRPDFIPLLPVFVILVGSWSVFIKVGGRRLLSGIGGWIYIGLPTLLALILTKNYEHVADGLTLLPAFLFIWINDTFAYLSGKTFGKHKLHPRISPGKTWEGFAGGFLITVALGVFLDHYYQQNFWWIMGGLASLFSTLGDLFESSIKRDLGVKDSGNILPGHGGILDRIDSFLFVIPVYYTVLAFIK